MCVCVCVRVRVRASYWVGNSSKAWLKGPFHATHQFKPPSIKTFQTVGLIYIYGGIIIYINIDVGVDWGVGVGVAVNGAQRLHTLMT